METPSVQRKEQGCGMAPSAPYDRLQYSSRRHDFMDTKPLFETAEKIAGRIAQEAKSRMPEDLPDGEQVKKLAGELADEAAAIVRKYPLQSCIAALAAGFVFGVFVNRKR
jgi:ElaB/YqjD/DUF883 family membrane-anchored ribosome-binding protein